MNMLNVRSILLLTLLVPLLQARAQAQQIDAQLPPSALLADAAKQHLGAIPDCKFQYFEEHTTHKQRYRVEFTYWQGCFLVVKELVDGVLFRAEGRKLVPMGTDKSKVAYIAAYDGATYQELSRRTSSLKTGSDIDLMRPHFASYIELNPIFNPWLTLGKYQVLPKPTFDRENCFGIPQMFTADTIRFLTEAAIASNEWDFYVLDQGSTSRDEAIATGKVNSQGFPVKFDAKYTNGGGNAWRIDNFYTHESEGRKLLLPSLIVSRGITVTPGAKATSDYKIILVPESVRFITPADNITARHFIIPSIAADIVENVDLGQIVKAPEASK